MVLRYSFGIAALLLALGAATYVRSAEREGTDPPVHPEPTAEEELSAARNPSPQADSLIATSRPVTQYTESPAPPAPDAVDPQRLPAVAWDAPAEEIDDPEPTVEQRAQLIRLPLISAIRASHPDADARYHAMREALARSGPSRESWTRSASRVFESWSAGLPKGVVPSLEANSVRCFLAGCEVEVRFQNRSAYDRAAEAFRSMSEDDAGHGGRVQTPPVETNDGVLASWMMLRPNIAPPGE